MKAIVDWYGRSQERRDNQWGKSLSNKNQAVLVRQ